MNSGISDKSFTQQWLQSLTLVAREPVAQSIKPMLETINELGRLHAEGDRLVSAKKLWEFCSTEGLLPILELMPLQQPVWTFDPDDMFAYSRPGRSSLTDFDSFCQCLGMVPGEVALKAEVNSRDWLSMLRQEAVRLQQTLNTGGIPAGLTLHLDCTARWDLQGWAVRFAQAEWMVVRYEDSFSTERPELSEIEETLMWAISAASEAMLPKSVTKCTTETGPAPWMKSAPRLEPLHTRVLVTDAKHYPAWFRRVWSVVWTIIYREQNVLRGQANIDVVRQEIATCIKDVPKLTLWMFVFAKLVCECQLGRGLGISGDYLA